MRKTLLFVVLAAAAGLAQAQIKCWSENGKRVCGDTPPPGAKVTTVRGAAAPAEQAPATAAKDGAKDGAKGAAKGPMTAAEKEQDYRKRQAESEKAAAKADAEAKAQAARRENCNRAKEALRTYESGQRVAKTDAKGERYFLDEQQIAQEAASARKAVQDSCN
jgi:hypothetical protein